MSALYAQLHVAWSALCQVEITKVELPLETKKVWALEARVSNELTVTVLHRPVGETPWLVMFNGDFFDATRYTELPTPNAVMTQLYTWYVEQ